jgi:hypothetical protein
MVMIMTLMMIKATGNSKKLVLFVMQVDCPALPTSKQLDHLK